MKKVFVSSVNALSVLGFSPQETDKSLVRNVSGIKLHEKPEISPLPFYAATINAEKLQAAFKEYANPGAYSKLEQMLITSAKLAEKDTSIPFSSADTIFILSTTKGNIDQLAARKGIKLAELASVVAQFFKNKNTPIVISNACISGVAALLVGKRLIVSGKYKNAVVLGGDIVSAFTLSGFQSFKALSPGPCKPFDEKREGLSLGEGAATLVLSEKESGVVVAGGGVSNDANHISGPSRTGDGLFKAVSVAIRDAKINKESIGYVSAHGTATLYNDEMECKALNQAGLSNVPLNSLKGFVGHTLGAAGLMESVMGIYAMEKSRIYPSCGYEKSGVSLPLNVIKESLYGSFDCFLKTASGFGGCNAALIFQKNG